MAFVVGSGTSLAATPAAEKAPDNRPECSLDLVKPVFLFIRNPARTEADFADHYIHNHAVLGRNLQRTIRGYTVNIVQNTGQGRPDAITEVWVPMTSDGSPDFSTATPDERRIVVDDDRTMFDRAGKSGGQLGGGPYIVKREVTVLAGDPLPWTLGEATPEYKTILFYRNAADVPAKPPAGARRVVDGYVSHIGIGAERSRADIAVFRSIWSAQPLHVTGVDSVQMKEYRQIIPPVTDWCSR
jgi:hypothetical protein